MTKAELMVWMAQECQLSLGQAEEGVRWVFEVMAKALVQGDRIEIRGFGSIVNRAYPGYQGRNPKTGEPVWVQPKRRPFFKPAKAFKPALDQKASRADEADQPLA